MPNFHLILSHHGDFAVTSFHYEFRCTIKVECIRDCTMIPLFPICIRVCCSRSHIDVIDVLLTKVQSRNHWFLI